ncbi:MAG: hypothetical protein LZF86_240082 [Nitrospira sp.]|nr:MAG: hypothetical protein LZF86_240082 [Nitrospira sp.]
MSPGIYIDEIDPGAIDMPSITRELARASLEQICERELAWFVNEASTPETRAQLTELLRGHLVMRWVKDAIKGRTAHEAFYLRCEHPAATQADLENGVLICEVGMAPVHPSEFVAFRILIRFASQT